VLCAVVDLATGGITVHQARHAVGPLAAPVGFLLAAVPLAVLLDRLGFFAAVAGMMNGGGRRGGGLWILAALVTTVLNLDAAVVLLTPLYVSIARRTGRDPLALAFQPVLLASLASSALPVSNLTNLIAASATGASTAGFVTHLALPSLVATAVGWFCYRRVLAPSAPVPLAGAGSPPAPGSRGDPGHAGPNRAPGSERTALAVGGAVVAVVLVGFVSGRSVGLAPWVVALAADVVLMVVTRWVPWRAVPWGTALVAGALGILAAGSVAHLAVGRVIGGHGTPAVARTVVVSGVAANLVNNLPALLVALPTLDHHAGPTLWAVLAGVNMGPVLLVTASLASLLWLDALGRLGVRASGREYSRIGLRVGVPAVLAGWAVLVLMVAVT
jgi:arsenical pump membrane protein